MNETEKQAEAPGEPSEITTTLTHDLQADATNRPTGASELARLVGLEGRVRAVIGDIRQMCREGGIDPYSLGKWRGMRDAADLLEAALSATPAEPTEPGRMTAEQGWQVWRKLMAEKKMLPLFSYSWLGIVTCELVAISLPPQEILSSASDPDPLTAFSKAYAAFLEACGEKVQG